MSIRRTDRKDPRELKAASFFGAQRIFSTDAYPTGTSNVTIQNQIPALGEFTGLRLWYANQNATASTLSGFKVATSDTDGVNGSALTWTAGTIAGASSAVLPVSTGTTPNQILTLTATDIIQLQSAAYAMVRSNFSGNASADNPAAGELTALNSLTGKIYKTGFASGVVADTTGITMTAGQLIVPYAAEFIYRKPTVTVAAVGGSTLRGQGTTGNAYGLIHQVCVAANLLDPSRIYSPYIAARSGSNSTTALDQATEIITKVKPQILIILAGSGNDSDLTAVGFSQMKNRVGRIVSLCRQNNVKPLVVTVAPADLSDAVEALRVATNLWVNTELAPYMDTADIATPVTDPANPKRILPAYLEGSDQLHLNDTGHGIMKNILLPKILRY